MNEKDENDRSEHVAKHRTMIVTDNDVEGWCLKPQQFSSWQRLTRVTTWVYRFINNCHVAAECRKDGEVGTEELTEAEHSIIIEARNTGFPGEYMSLLHGKTLPKDSRIISLNPKIDEDGLLCSDGRLIHANALPYDVKYPIILPRKSWVSKLIVKHHHEMGNHTAGTNQT